MEFKQVSNAMFLNNLEWAQNNHEIVRQATTPVNDITYHEAVDCYLAFYGTNYAYPVGYAVSENGKLTSVFSSIKGQGTNIMQSAIKNGARHLDCFDGFLPTFYSKFGFKEVRREKNWTAGQPDVVYMRYQHEGDIMPDLKIIYWDKELSKTVSKQGTINGYPVGYDKDAELSWVLISKSKHNPIVLAAFKSQDDMEILLNSTLKTV